MAVKHPESLVYHERFNYASILANPTIPPAQKLRLCTLNRTPK